jgi:hypothetical protein
VGKARSLPKSGASERFLNRVGPCFTYKHYTRLEKLARDKHTSLLQKFVACGRKKFYYIGSWWYEKLIFKNCIGKDLLTGIYKVYYKIFSLNTFTIVSIYKTYKQRILKMLSPKCAKLAKCWGHFHNIIMLQNVMK